MDKRPQYDKLIALCILAAVLGALVFVQWKMRQTEPRQPVVVKEKAILSIYVPTAREKLTRKNFEMQGSVSDTAKAELIMRELKRENAIPEKLILHEFATDREGTMYLNLSQHIRSEEMSPTEEIAVLYSIVNSFLSNFRDAKKVQLLVEGQGLYTMKGLVFTYLPLEFNNQLMED